MPRRLLDIDTLFARGALDQRCPRCGHCEAAGSYCTRCLRRTGLAHYRAARRIVLRGLALPKGAPIAA
jgi:hypothetical protein